MMYLPIKLREPTGSYIPRGPRFSSAQPVRFLLDGSNIEFHAPRHSPKYRVNRAVQPARHVRLDDLIFHPVYKKTIHLADTWEYTKLFYRCWAFNGPWFTGPLAEMCMALNLLRPRQPRQGVSYYHPRAFEQAVGDYLTNRYALRKQDGRSVWIAPARWQPLQGLPVPAVHVQVQPDEAVTLLESTDEFVIFPVADQVLAIMAFYLKRQGKGTEAEIESRISKANMVELMGRITSSLRIELSPQAQVLRDQAIQGLEDTALIEHFPPMKWTTAEDDALWASKHPDIPPLDPTQL